jgi:hypothetical protein
MPNNSRKWLSLKKELQRETKRIFMDCPDEILRYRYGVITHSDAGKHALNQYFGHWVHAYAHYMLYSGDILDSICRLARDPSFKLEHCKKMFIDNSKPSGEDMLLVAYGGQKSLGLYIEKVISAFDSVDTKEDFIDLIKTFQSYATRLYWWFHWYFPWGIGSSICRRLEAEDIGEIARLAGYRLVPVKR